MRSFVPACERRESRFEVAQGERSIGIKIKR